MPKDIIKVRIIDTVDQSQFSNGMGTPLDVLQKDTNMIDPVFHKDILPEIVNLEYFTYEQAAIAAIKYIPYLYENLKGIISIGSNKSKMKIVVTTGSKHSFNFRWKLCSGSKSYSDLKVLNTKYRSDSFKTMILCYQALKQLDHIQLLVVEDIQEKQFLLSINQVDLIKFIYKDNDVANIKVLRRIKEDILNNNTATTQHQEQAKAYIDDVILKYRLIELPNRLNIETEFPSQKFVPSEKITVSTKKIIPAPKPKSKKKQKVATCLVIAPDRDDRFDHDD